MGLLYSFDGRSGRRMMGLIRLYNVLPDRSTAVFGLCRVCAAILQPGTPYRTLIPV